MIKSDFTPEQSYYFSNRLSNKISDNFDFCASQSRLFIDQENKDFLYPILQNVKYDHRNAGAIHLINAIWSEISEEEMEIDKKELNDFVKTIANDSEKIIFSTKKYKVIPFNELTQWEQDYFTNELSRNMPEDRKIEIQPLDPKVLKDTQKAIKKAFKLLKKINKNAYKDALGWIKLIVIMNVPGFISGSSYETIGNVTLTDVTVKKYIVDYLEAIVHEAAHTLLFTLSSGDAIVFNPMDEMYTSALRKDPRPMVAIYHTFFVSCRISIIMYQLLEKKIRLKEEERDRAIKILRKFYAVYMDAYKVLWDHGRLTVLCTVMARECLELMEPLNFKAYVGDTPIEELYKSS